ncbi:MAG: VOC family protein [Deltaproteobacteria bacterium]|nr:VOC family protein [Deltaproteobacteria bacterium]
MKIEHVAIWAKDIEALKDFYIKYFNGVPGIGYLNEKRGFSSYFVSFEAGARLEIMYMPSVSDPGEVQNLEFTGLTHLAFSVGSAENVCNLTERLRVDGFMVVDEPRITGDGYFESVVLDPENNRIEITV